MQTRSRTNIDKDYIDHAIKFTERRALGDNDPVLDRLNLEIIQVKPPMFFFLQVYGSHKQYILPVAEITFFVV